MGIVNGVGNNRFDPYAPITREQAAVMLLRTMGVFGICVIDFSPTFYDMSEVSDWAVTAVGQVQALEVMAGIGGNKFAPQDPYTIEQSIVTIWRLVNVFRSVQVVPVHMNLWDITNEQLAKMVESGEIPAYTASLFLSENSLLTDISPLSTLTNLRELRILWGNNITDLSPLSNLTNLTSLDLWGEGQPIDLSVISNLRSLTRLSLAYIDLSDMSSLPLNDLPNLTELGLWETQVTDITPLIGLTSLMHLRLSYNQIADITALSGLSAMYSLSLSENQITDITPLSGLTSLVHLNLNNNQIDDISPLSGLTSLTHLNLDNNQIDDISPLRNLRNLQQLNVIGNPLTDAQIDELRTTLPSLSILSLWNLAIAAHTEDGEY